MAVNTSPVGRLGKFQTLPFEVFNPGIIKANNMDALYRKAPNQVSNLMVELLAFRRGKNLETFLNKFPKREFEDDSEYTWEVIGSTSKNIPLVEARNEDGEVVTSGSGNVGAGTAPFYLVFSEGYFNDGEYIVGNLNELYQFRILGEPKMEGTNFVYKVELAGGNTDGCPADRLLSGERFSYEAAYVEADLSRKVGGIRMATPVKMRNEFSTIRKYTKASGKMLNKKIAIGIPLTKTVGGKTSKITENFWMHYVTYLLEEEFRQEKNRVIAYSRSNRDKNGVYHNIGKSGEVIRQGAGLYEQMEVANTIYYNKFSLKLLENALYEISRSKLGWNERTFIIRTGMKGAEQFHKAVNSVVSGWTQFVLDNNSIGVIKKSSGKEHPNLLSAGYQFNEYIAPNGIKIHVEVDDSYDDEIRNKIQHPLGGPAWSYRYDIFDIGSMDQPNIFLCCIKGQHEIRGYRAGFRNPFTGEVNNNHMSYDEDSAEFHIFTQLGVCVLDPTRTLSLIPSVLQG